MTPLADMPAVLTVEEAGELLRIGRSAAYQAVKAGEIPSIKVGRSIRVPRHRLEQLLGLETNEARADNADLVKDADAGGGRDTG